MSKTIRLFQILALALAGAALAQNPPATTSADLESELQECPEGINPWGSDLTCLYVEQRDNGDVVQTPFINGLINGTRIERRVSGTVIETPYSNHRMHGTRVVRWGQGGETQTPYVENVKHGTRIERRTDGRVTETTFDNDVQVERRCVAGCD